MPETISIGYKLAVFRPNFVQNCKICLLPTKC